MRNTLRTAGIFGDGMILQRNEENEIWGTDSLADEVTVLLDGSISKGKVESGRFRILLPAHDAGTGFTIVIKGSEIIEIKDVGFGDVYLLSGQSNMELPVGRVMDVSGDDINSQNDPDIRQYRLTPDYVFGENEESSLPSSQWSKAVPGEILEMSAAGFFFARKLKETVGVPVGLILNAQGGASVEAFMSMEKLNQWDDLSDQIAPFLEKGSLLHFLEERETRIRLWYESIDANVKETYSKEIPAEVNCITLPGMFSGSDGSGFTGSMWFFKEVYLEPVSGGKGVLYLGELIDSDRTYINGVLVGETAYRYPPRKYDFDTSILRAGSNLIAVRLVIENGCGGFIPEHPYYLEAGNQHIELAGNWVSAIEKAASYPAEEGFLAQKLPSGLFRASILPLKGISMKGILWYQGETNAGSPEHYDEKFGVMISEWREHLRSDLPIICVEMPDYNDPITGAGDGWAEIQKMQREAPGKVRLCEVVSAKDLGAPFELHPQLKSELGERLAEKALTFIYDR